MSEEVKEEATSEAPQLYVRGVELYSVASPADIEAQPFVRTLLTQNARLVAERATLQQKLVELTEQWKKEGAELKNRVYASERDFEELTELLKPTEAVNAVGLLEEMLKFEERVKYSDDTLEVVNRYIRAAYQLMGGSLNSKAVLISMLQNAIQLTKACRLERPAAEPK